VVRPWFGIFLISGPSLILNLPHLWSVLGFEFSSFVVRPWF
jgi:hypothetical protein